MIGKTADQKQRILFNPLLTDFINMGHELVLLANKIEWKYFEKEFSGFYSITGQPAVPIRMMVGCLLLKQMYNLGDETLAQAWVRDPYMQYFCGAAHFQYKLPFDPSDFVHSRKRIGLDGVEKIFKHTVTLHGEKATSKMVLSDTTVQENFVTYPTDAKQYKTIEPLLEQMKANEIRLPQEVVYDRGGKGEKEICGVKISTPGKPKRHDTSYEKRCKREKFRRRAAIEPIIGHLKSQFRMGQNYLSGKQSPQMNAFLSAAAWNLKKLMEQLIENGKKRIFAFLEKLLFLPIINFKITS